MGQKGFVSDLLETVVSKEREGSLANVTVSKPMSRQSVVEQRSAIALVGSDINELFDKKKTKSPCARSHPRKASEDDLQV
ncbi:hypothetical protein CEXT_814801 [Caerostris extrusa]|uniref:Uncharacterized protein n=1 Tax=Caerostris extrusa TaxID=172846 RepID=A0AAV4VLY9_CAEEX|nr:hypothetical protein CEXT_814801 [Caerostris extrusa]